MGAGPRGFDPHRSDHFQQDVAQLGRALVSGTRGCGFDSRHPDHLMRGHGDSMPNFRVAPDWIKLRDESAQACNEECTPSPLAPISFQSGITGSPPGC